jgi:hypothetical protein
MRSDYSFYVVALICFIIAGVFLADVTGIDPTMSQVSIAIFVILGILFIAGGYTFRPKVAVPTPKAPQQLPAEPSPLPAPPVEEKVEEAPAAPQPLAEEHVTSLPAPTPTPPAEEETPTPTPAIEEPAKAEEKPVRRRRRKKTT